MRWTHHYTGRDYAEWRRGSLSLYLSRDAPARWPTFARLSWGRRMIGVFAGRTNYLRGASGGLEFFTSRWHAGWLGDDMGRGLRVRCWWTGSNRRPYSAVTARCWRLAVGRQCPPWLERWKERREERRWSRDVNGVFDDGETG